MESKKDTKNFFVYTGGKRVSGIKSKYISWREKNKLLICCDNEKCVFKSGQLIWNGERLNLILDHINGVNSDNRLKNLRLLCPNCNSQLISTQGGKNIGRVEKSVGGFCLINKEDGKKHYVLPAETGVYKLSFY